MALPKRQRNKVSELSASGLERGRQLSKIYKEPDYTQAVAETEVFALPDADKARRQRRKTWTTRDSHLRWYQWSSWRSTKPRTRWTILSLLTERLAC
jgi:hypothetical protein